ncbi:MAG: LpxI family protein [Pirellulaceae bacterium]
MREKIGLIAGWGDFPVAVAQQLHGRGFDVFCAGYHGHADQQALRPLCRVYKPVGMARLGAQARYFRRNGVTRAMMAGKVFKTVIFQRFYWLRHTPDLAFIRFFYPHFVTKTANRNDDDLLLTAIRLFRSYGVDIVPATDLAPELLVKEGNLTQRRPNDAQQRDIEFGWQIARKMGGLDVGQSVAVQGRVVLAVEAIEGTDECIRRAGMLCPTGGFTVVKVAKPQQDMRFDVPTIGVGTLKTLKIAGGSVLAIEADKTIILDQQAVMEFANRHKIAVVALNGEAMDASCCAAA